MAMNIQSYKTPPRWWSPKLSRRLVKLLRPFRRRLRLKVEKVVDVQIRGIEYLKDVLEDDCGVMIAPNHSNHSDPLVLYGVADEVDRPFYFMAAWHVFAKVNPVYQMFFRRHGCFSVDREGTDIRAFRQSVEILQNSSYPLVIFPEGEIYHVNDRVTPFRDGPAAIAVTARKRSGRAVVCVPCAMKYTYIEDPTAELVELMGQLEERIIWRPRPDLGLAERIYRFAEGLLGLKELEYLGGTQEGTLPERIRGLGEIILKRLEEQYSIQSQEQALPVRVKVCRREAIKRLEENDDEVKNEQIKLDLDDLFIVTQLFSYPGDYVASKPTVERMAETLDKFEEDILRKPKPVIRGVRKVVVSFGEAVEVKLTSEKKDDVHTLTESLEKSVQRLLDEI